MRRALTIVAALMVAACAHRGTAEDDWEDVLALGGDRYIVTTYGKVWYTGADLLRPGIERATAYCKAHGKDVMIGESESAGVSGALTRGMATHFTCVPSK